MSTQKACRDFDVLLSACVDHEATADEVAIVETQAKSFAACASRLDPLRDAGAAARGQYAGRALRGRGRQRTSGAQAFTRHG